MANSMSNKLFTEAFGPTEGNKALLKQALLVVVGIAAMALASKIRVPMWPVPVTMQTFAVLTIGSLYGARLGLVTMLGYLALGAAGMQVFTGENAGLAYLVGPTGGYLLGFALAMPVMGYFARLGWDRSILGMAGAMFVGNVVVYAAGLPWMAHLFLEAQGAEWVLKYGMTNFLIGDALKLALAAVAVPGIWSLTGRKG